MIASFIALVIVGTKAQEEIRFAKTVLDTRFVSEGVAVGDVNRDGKLDVIAGNVWYQAPDWKANEIAPFVFVEPKAAWSNSFHNWAEDLNGDGWVDQIVIGMPGEKAVWRENPKGNAGPWKEHLIWRSAGNESPLYVDLFGNGKRVLVMAYDDKHLAWFEPSSDPYAPWVCHDVSEMKGAGSQRYSHGLGVGDLKWGDERRLEIITKDGYYVPTHGPNGLVWDFVKADLGADCAQMLVLEGSVLSTSAHARGVWWHQPAAGNHPYPMNFKKTTIDETVSVTHAAVLATFKGKPNLLTGKRKWGHPPGVDPGSEEPHWLVRYELVEGKWTRHVIDEDSGVGTQFVVQDMNKDGLPDIVTANKNGVFLFLQVPKGQGPGT
ncbi:MAG: VCBS repeat-containing protein [Fimbriimonadaceae bacterium]